LHIYDIGASLHKPQPFVKAGRRIAAQDLQAQNESLPLALLKQLTNQSPADAAISEFFQQRNVDQPHACRTAVNHYSPHRSIIHTDNLVVSIRIGASVRPALRLELHIEEEILLLLGPSPGLNLTAARVAVKAPEELLVLGRRISLSHSACGHPFYDRAG
jgi:hypothetical protein